jgi:hypothetical protein
MISHVSSSQRVDTLQVHAVHSNRSRSEHGCSALKRIPVSRTSPAFPLVGIEPNPGPHGLSQPRLRRDPSRRRNPRAVQPNYDTGQIVPVDCTFPRRIRDNAIYNIVQSFESTATATSSTIANTYTYNNFVFNLMDQNSQLSAVFDQYRVQMLEFTYYPRINVVDGNSAGPTNSGFFHTVIDYDDSSLLTSIGQALDYPNCLVTPGSVIQKRTFVPHVAVAAYAGAFTSFANMGPTWIDCTSNGVVHYGVKTAWTVTSQALTYDVVCRVWMQFRNVR